MKTKFQVNPIFARMKDFMESLPAIFDENGETIKKDRNEIKIIQHGDLKLCIKSFNRVTVFNRYIYSWFRATKAKRSYKVARKLEKRNINTPAPVGYVEVYGRWGILEKAFYVSLYQEHDYDMADVLDKSIAEQEVILTAFAEYMAKVVHPAGAWHNDLSPGNVLINSKENGEWSFSFIDLNRLVFKNRISSFQGLTNLKKMTNKPVALSLMAEQYALAAKKNPQFYSILLMRDNLFFGIRRSRIKRILHIFKPRKKVVKPPQEDR
ncbi:MAG: lipopolysaccharide kinase InaA family protein [Dysgonamonadaceae bacterium]|jgi:thiamine kinase-like enzyme|nr:lipopolysaccharide kinase InaA family protein [Dysgonamonadaceae bacterium]